MKLLQQLSLTLNYFWIVGSQPCIPSTRETAIIIGQDFEAILNYSSFFRSVHPNPFGLMGYTTLSGKEGELTGLVHPIDYGSGIEWVDGLIEKFPHSSINLGLYLVDQLEFVINGQFDHILNRFMAYIAQRKSSTNFYLRIGYEFDNPTNHYSPTQYVKAFQYIVQSFRKAKIDNILFVWHSMGEEIEGDSFTVWFPGIEYVDMCGISIFQQPYRCTPATYCTMPRVEEFAKFCQIKQIPIMIAESTPFGGMISNEQERQNASITNLAGFRGNTWDHWFVPVLSFIHSYDVRIWSYINCNWNALPMWQVNHAPGIYWGDSRIENSEEISESWTEFILHSNSTILTYSSCYQSKNSTHIQLTLSLFWKIFVRVGVIMILLYWVINRKLLMDDASFNRAQQPYQQIP